MSERPDIRAYNRDAWDEQVRRGNRWTVPVDAEVIAAARQGEWEVVLTPTKPVPRSWFPPLEGCELLCLASAGGQQGPIFAAAGARVCVLDNSPAQLGQDRRVADEHGLEIETVEGDMADLSRFEDRSFDLVFHACSNCFVPAVRPVWKEAFRVLRPRGVLLAGFLNPVVYLFDEKLLDEGVMEVRHRIPYSDVDSLGADGLRWVRESGRPLEFGHTLDDQIGGQLAAGFQLTGFFEDGNPEGEEDPVSERIATSIATRAVRPG